MPARARLPTGPPKRCSQLARCPDLLFSWLETGTHPTRPVLPSGLPQTGPFQPVCRFPPARLGAPGPGSSIPAPASPPHPRGRPSGRRGLAQGAARDPERKGPSLGPNAGGVSLDRRRLGTTAGTGDKVTYQSRFGARADTPRPTGNAELFKRPYRLLYLSRRKASCRETKDVPYLEIRGHRLHPRRGSAQTAPIRARGAQPRAPRPARERSGSAEDTGISRGSLCP